MRFNWLAGLLLCSLCGFVSAEEAVRNYGATSVDSSAVSGYTGYTVPPPVAVAGQSTVIAGDSAAVSVAFGHHRRRCCGGGCGVAGCGGGMPAYYGNAFTTYQPNVYATGYGLGYGPGNYGPGYYGSGYRGGYYGPSTPNPYGYYPNGMIWGSSGPTYSRPFPVWDSPSGVYDYRYRGWGSYGWGGWGGTGPAGWGYQGGFYW